MLFKQHQSIPYEVRTCNTFGSKTNSVKYGTETILCLAAKISPSVRETTKNSKSLELFKLKIRK